MSKVRDLTGRTFGKLRVLEITDERSNGGYVMWRVQCTGSCNSNPYLISSNSLISGHSTQCQKCKWKSYIRDLTGQVFGKWKVLEMADKRGSGRDIMCKVQCLGECNSEPYLVRSRLLVSGESTQCRICRICSNRKKGRDQIINLTGRVFGKLKVLEMSSERQRRKVLWKVQCTGDCNSVPYLIRSDSLISGKSTQCKRCSLRNLSSMNISKTEKLLIDRVEEYIGVQVVRQFQLENRFYDAYIPQLNMLIESNGDYWHERNGTDEEKKALAKEYGFNLVPVTNNSQKDIPTCFNIIKTYIDETSRSLND